MTQLVGVDTTVLYAAGNRRTQRHEAGLAIVSAADQGDLPRLRVPDVVLVESMNGLSREVGHRTAMEMLNRLAVGSQFELVREPMTVWQQGLDRFRSTQRLSLADAVIVAGLRHAGLENLYSFDDGFDGVEGLTRLATPDDPFAG